MLEAIWLNTLELDIDLYFFHTPGTMMEGIKVDQASRNDPHELLQTRHINEVNPLAGAGSGGWEQAASRLVPNGPVCALIGS